MYGFINKPNAQTGSARGAIYQQFSGPPARPDDGRRAALLESAKRFFGKRKQLGATRAFSESVTSSIKPEWLLWAVSPALSQAERINIATQTKVKPQSPPWRQ